jgi:endogenous inhibitor of DNA gyrase (YacG/DUF329 family)
MVLINGKVMIEFIKNNLLNSRGINPKRLIHNGKWIKDNYPDMYDKIMDQFKHIDKLSIKIYVILYGESVCKECGKPTKFISFRLGFRPYCSNRCQNLGTKESRKSTMLIKYGVEHPLQSKEIMNKNKQTCLIKFNCETFFGSDDGKEAIHHYNNTLGIKNISQLEDVKDKKRKTCISNFGVDSPMKCKSIYEKANNTSIDRYGKSSILIAQNKWIEHDRIKRFNIIKSETIQEAYDCGYTILMMPEYTYEKMKIECNKGHKYDVALYSWRYGIRCPYCSNNVSTSETEVADFISLNVNEIKRNYRKLINPKEIDIFLPSHNIGIEYNGLYWHAKDDFHILEKTELCAAKGVQLIHIFEDEWLYKRDIVKSMILSKLGIYGQRIGARECILGVVSSAITEDFLYNNHIQGNCISGINLGLYYNDILVSIMIFGKRKITGSVSKNEMLRYCTKLNTQVIGGYHKLFNYYIKNYNPEEIISYADRRWFTGKMYKELQFKLDHISKPNYWYIKGKHRFNRMGFQKHKLHVLKNFDVNLTEWQNMQANGYNRIWDCGNYVYTW